MRCLWASTLRVIRWILGFAILGGIAAVVACYVNPPEPVRDPFTGQVMWEPPNPIAGLGGAAFWYMIVWRAERRAVENCERRRREECVKKKLDEYLGRYPDALLRAKRECGALYEYVDPLKI